MYDELEKTKFKLDEVGGGVTGNEEQKAKGRVKQKAVDAKKGVKDTANDAKQKVAEKANDAMDKVDKS